MYKDICRINFKTWDHKTCNFKNLFNQHSFRKNPLLEWRDETDLEYQIFVVFYVWPKKTYSYLLKSFISLSIWNDFMLLIWRYLPHELPLKKNPPRNLSICPSDSWPKVKVYKRKSHISAILLTKSNFVPGSLKPSQVLGIH